MPVPRPQHVLYVCWGFPPYDGPSTPRALATVEALLGAGHRVTVLTTDLTSLEILGGVDRSLLTEVPQAVAVLRVPFPAVRADPVVSRWPDKRVQQPERWLAELDAWERGAFPEQGYAPWRPRIESAAYRLHRSDPVDLVLATGGPYVSFAAALHLSVECDVPFVLDDRDGWLVGTGPAEDGEPEGLAEQYWSVMLARSRQAWFTSSAVADGYRTRYPASAGKIMVVADPAGGRAERARLLRTALDDVMVGA